MSADTLAVLDARWRKAIEPPPPLTVVEWAAQVLEPAHVKTPYDEPYDSTATPYCAEPMEAFCDPDIEIIDLCFGAQTGKTALMRTCLCYAIDRDPGPTLWVTDTEPNARSFSRQRLHPIFDGTPALARHKPDDSDLYAILEMSFDSMVLAMVGSNSPGNLASRPIRYLIADEIDKYPPETRREGSSLHLAMRRTVHFWNRCILRSSTPSLADGMIWLGLLGGDWRQYWVPCPRCNAMQVLTFPNIRKPEGLRDADAIKAEAWYECEHCETRIRDADKPAMLAAGEWRPRADPVQQYDWTPPPPGGSHRSYHLPGWYSPWRGFGEVLAAFTAAAHQPMVLREVINSDLAEPWEERGETRTEDQVLAHRGDYPEGTFPSDAAPVGIFISVDAQRDSLVYVVRAWGVHESSWQLSYGVLPPALSSLVPLAARTYGGRPAQVGAIDSGDGTRTAEIYEFCRTHPGWVPLKGIEGQAAPVSWSMLDRMPDGTPIPGGIRLLRVATNHFRSALYARLAIAEGDPGYWALHADADMDYAKQLVAYVLIERQDRLGRLHREWKQVRRADHYLDCETYQLAMAYAYGIRFAPDPGEAAAPPAPPPPDAAGKESAWRATRLKV